MGDAFEHKRIPWALKMCVCLGGIGWGGGEKNRVGARKYTSLNKNRIKKTRTSQ